MKNVLSWIVYIGGGAFIGWGISTVGFKTAEYLYTKQEVVSPSKPKSEYVDNSSEPKEYQEVLVVSKIEDVYSAAHDFTYRYGYVNKNGKEVRANFFDLEDVKVGDSVRCGISESRETGDIIFLKMLNKVK